MAQIPACKHEKTRLIAKDNEAEYIECTACGAILETHELADSTKTSNAETPKLSPGEPERGPGKSTPFDESLSDA